MNKEYIERELIYKLPKIDLYECVNSTNTLMKELAKEGGREFCVIIAEQQSGGRGRKGRTFHSPKGSGVYMSILLRPNESLNPLYITTYAAVCCARAFEKLINKKTYIKWVNDIYVDGKKVCGILTESSLGENGYAVLGIGVNVTVPDGGFPDDIKLRAGALFEEEKEHMREDVATQILNEFITAYKKCEKDEILKEYRQKSLVTGKRIEIIENGVVEQADAIGIDDEFALVVKKDDGKLYTLNSGDVSIVI